MSRFAQRWISLAAAFGICACGASTTGTAGSGGSAGTGGSAGAGGTAGMGGTAGAGGTAGTGGTAGAGGGVAAGCPTTLETLTNWFETPSDTDIADFSSIDALLTFRNNAGQTLDIDSTQFWSIPSVEDIPFSLSNFPINGIADGAEFTILLVLDLTGLSSTEVGFAIRPNSPMLGNVGPSSISFVSAEFACDP